MKAFLLSFTFFVSAYLWATSFTLSSFEKGVLVLDQSQNESEESTCIRDLSMYCDYNTNYSVKQCWEMSEASCKGKVSAMRNLLEAAKSKSVTDLKDFPL